MHRQELPPIILLLLDSAGANRFSLYGHYRPTTPNLERMAAETAVYRHCFANAPWTIPSHVSLLTGLYPHEHGSNITFDGMPQSLVSLPEILQEQGYHTIGISNNMIISHRTGFDRGFDKFYETNSLFQDEDFLLARSRYLLQKRQFNLTGEWNKLKFISKYAWENKYFYYPIKKVLNRLYFKYLGSIKNSTSFISKRTMWIFNKSIKRIKDIKAPFFFFINLMETHKPYSAPYPYNRMFQKVDPRQRERLSHKKIDDVVFEEDPDLRRERAEFWGLCQDQEVAYIDGLIGRLREFLVQQQLWARVMLIITSDHGEALGEHGLFGHNFSVYNELMHIPLIIKYPKDYRITGDFHQLAQLHDLFATLCQVADSPRPVPFSSKSLLDDPRDFALTALLNNSQGLSFLERRFKEFKIYPCMLPGNGLISADLWKLIRWEDGTRELYDLNRDFYESSNLIQEPEHASRAASLNAKLDELLVSLEAW